MKTKQILAAIVVITLTSALPAPAQKPPAEMLVWCGLDYSKVKMIGTLDFREPGQIFPDKLASWNSLFMKELLPQLEKMAKTNGSDLAAVYARNDLASSNQIERIDGTRDEMVHTTHLTEAHIAAMVRSYSLKYDKGLGLVFVMDRLVKAQATGCLFVVFFDIPSRQVVFAQRVCAEAGGMGFRNYWFRPVKAAVEKLPKMYRQAVSLQAKLP